MQPSWCKPRLYVIHSALTRHALPPCPPPQADAERLESEAKALSGPDGLAPDASGSDLQRALAAVADAAAAKKLAYNKFFAIGLFRCAVSTRKHPPP